MKSRLKGTSAVFVLLVFSMSIVIPLSKPVLSPVIIKLDDGKAIETIVSGIKGDI